MKEYAAKPVKPNDLQILLKFLLIVLSSLLEKRQ